MNPLLQKFETPFETAPFHLIENSHFLPALKEAISQGQEDIEKIKSNFERATFSNVCEALERAGKNLGRVSSVFFNLHSAESNDELQAIAKEFSPMLTAYFNDLLLDEELFEKIKKNYESREKLNLSSEEMTLVEKQYKNFVRNGALLSKDQKKRLREIDKELSSLRLHFGDNVLKESNDFVMLLDKEKELEGLPEGAKEAAALAAKERGHAGKWVVTLDYPSYIPFMKYAKNRELREKLFRAFTSKAFRENQFDNQKNVKDIVNLRFERANLLGYRTHANFVLEERMAETPERVEEFLNHFLDKAKPRAVEEMEELKAFATEKEGLSAEEFMPWDYPFWAEKLRKEKYDLDEEMLKPYFKLDNVIDGIFTVAEKLYGIRFKERRDIPVYHEDVRVFEVVDKKDRHIGVFYGDYFPRSGKRNGAWANTLRDQHFGERKNIRPHVVNICNFTKPTESKPSLLTFNEVLTLFHEFGHGLHALLSDCKYESLGGTHVFWDFVELPSQIMENWAFEKECLDLFATHFETGEKIPEELIEKIKASKNFHEGLQTLRQLSFALLDMSWHNQDPSGIEDVNRFEKEVMKECQLLPVLLESNMSCSFGHIFQGGYSAGYYSYKWAEVLDADAFEHFKEKGIFDRLTAENFQENVLSKGGSEHPMELYKRFRGREPDPEALLRRAGLI